MVAVDAPTKYISLSSEQLVLPDAVVDAAEKAFPGGAAQPVVTYLANSLVIGSGDAEKRIPYSTITGVDSVAGVGPLLDAAGEADSCSRTMRSRSIAGRPMIWARRSATSVTVNYYEPESTHGVLREHQPAAGIQAGSDRRARTGRPADGGRRSAADAGAQGRDGSGFDQRLGLAVRVGGKDPAAGRGLLGSVPHDAQGVCVARHGETALGQPLGHDQPGAHSGHDGRRRVAKTRGTAQAGRRRSDVSASERAGPRGIERHDALRRAVPWLQLLFDRGGGDADFVVVQAGQSSSGQRSSARSARWDCARGRSRGCFRARDCSWRRSERRSGLQWASRTRG